MAATTLNDYNIDPLESLAFAMHSQRGTHALLLGSGISTSAGIPTGWNIMLDLIQKLARMKGAKGIDESNAEKWYCDKFGEDKLAYSSILSGLAKTSAERQHLLQKYFEPTKQEREDGEKQPAKAHHAIAELMGKGFVRIIITTNFDRLLENALREHGVEPLVIKSYSDIKGMAPLAHQKGPCIIKLNGDYKDTNLRNIKSELGEYSRDMRKLLKQIFDEFGLIVCGWSAEWDEGLRKLIMETKTRRYTTYWATRREPGEAAQDVIKKRDAQIIRIEGADSFFQRLREHLQSLDDISRPHPLSINMAVAALKRYLPEEKHLIKMNDLLQPVVKQTETAISEIALNSPAPTADTVLQRCGQYATTMSQLMSLAVVGAHWEQPYHRDIWKKMLSRLSNDKDGDGYLAWRIMRRFPGTLILYALGMGAMANDKLAFIGHILQAKAKFKIPVGAVAGYITPVRKPHELVSTRIMPVSIVGESGFSYEDVWRVSNRMHDIMYKHAGQFFANQDEYTRAFGQLEMLLFLNCLVHSEDEDWDPYGSYMWRYKDSHVEWLKEVRESIKMEQGQHEMVQAGIFGKDYNVCIDNIDRLVSWMKSRGR